MKVLIKKHPYLTGLIAAAIFIMMLILILGQSLLPGGTEDVIVINEFGASQPQTIEYTEERADSYARMYGNAENIVAGTDFQSLFESLGYEAVSHFYNLVDDETGLKYSVRDEGFRFLKNGNQEFLLIVSKEGIPLRRQKTSLMHAELSRISQVSMIVMGDVSVSKEERYQVFIQDYNGVFVYIRTVHIAEEELIPYLQNVVGEIAEAAQAET